ncbi:DarT ssDNA thymidine ADP-ribosyltransferase family protein [Pseudomonas sp. CD3(2023)]|uniref:DarT ssDNA thymidine ADP-ribosyltransferase family protein n=1 Tax=Pseudomonas TaxID=286 RepID=UPI00209B36B2|nr:DarT ssDNA thymidine ADP-ribosyltransferase family protein [Pseudomonas guariconensis]MCO7631996.1 DUF4433 domain-containing protein [Pseudomonas guariconensis]
MKNLLSKYGVDGIWHFTDLSNLQSIIDNGGLLSLVEANKRGIKIPAPGGNEWSHDADKINGVDNYVHLAFLDDHPMLFHTRNDGRTPNPIWLKISIDILDTDGVRYTSDVSNKTGVPLLSPEVARNEIDLEVMFTYMDWKNPEIRQRRSQALRGEILIPSVVPVNMILGKKNG